MRRAEELVAVLGRARVVIRASGRRLWVVLVLDEEGRSVGPAIAPTRRADALSEARRLAADLVGGRPA